MTELEAQLAQLAELRTRRTDTTLYARIRRMRPFDRRSIREPAERDAYWVNVQRRLAAIELEARTLYATADR
ncbi:MAG TPA: hypothetical protein VHR55_02410 [Candidatus Limnocylindria bacterium]|nr:hypothetical protein [Candidatus Limnocylindria bacterium]